MPQLTTGNYEKSGMKKESMYDDLCKKCILNECKFGHISCLVRAQEEHLVRASQGKETIKQGYNMGVDYAGN